MTVHAEIGLSFNLSPVEFMDSVQMIDSCTVVTVACLKLSDTVTATC